MKIATSPLLDPINNPFYCPAIPPAAYLHALRVQVRRHQRRYRGVGTRGRNTGKDASLLLCYARLLGQAVGSGTSEEDGGNPNSEGGVWLIGHLPSCSAGGSSGSLCPSGPLDHPSWERSQSSSAIEISYPYKSRKRSPTSTATTILPTSTVRKRKLSSLNTYTDLRGPPKYARSIQSFHDSSYDVELKRERLDFYDSLFPSSPAILKPSQENDTNPNTKDDVQAFVDRLDADIIPGTRIKERILDSGLDVNFQNVADLLATNGFLTERILNIISKETTIWRLSLSESMVDENGLNLCGNDFLTAFKKPNSFSYLSELSFSGTRVEDFHLINIHHLPRLSTLFLNNTRIGNEAVFLLVPLKNSLRQLTIATNPHIDDESVPAILLLSKLSFLSILDTSITMDGLRHFAKTISKDKRVMDIEIPFACEQYIDTLETKYLLNIKPPFISNPETCNQLSNVVLIRNLTAHAEVNPNILPTGTRDEMIERLEGILRRREMDLVVRAMVTGEVFTLEKLLTL